MIVLLSHGGPKIRALCEATYFVGSRKTGDSAGVNPPVRLGSNVRLRALAQYEFLDLSGRGLRQRAEQHGPGRLETREMLAAEGDDLLGRCGRFGLQGDKGARGFAPHRIGAGYNRGFEHGRVAVKDVFYFDCRDVLAARDDDVFRAVLQLDIA